MRSGLCWPCTKQGHPSYKLINFFPDVAFVKAGLLWVCPKLGRSGSCRFPSVFLSLRVSLRRLFSDFGGEDHALSVFCGFLGPSMYNKLPTKVKEASLLSSFKTQIKKYLYNWHFLIFNFSYIILSFIIYILSELYLLIYSM